MERCERHHARRPRLVGVPQHGVEMLVRGILKLLKPARMRFVRNFVGKKSGPIKENCDRESIAGRISTLEEAILLADLEMTEESVVRQFIDQQTFQLAARLKHVDDNVVPRGVPVSRL